MWRKILLGSVIILLLAIFLSPRLPFQDYPDWIYQAKVLKELIKDNPIYTQNFWVKSCFIPNTTTTVFISLVSFLVPVDLAGRFFAAISFLLLFMGIRGLFGSRENREVSEVIGLIMATSIFFFSGILAFNFGIALFFVFFYAIRAPEGRWQKIFYFMISLVIIFYTHFLILFIAFTNLFFRAVFYKDNRLPRLVDSIVSAIPAIILSILYLSGPSASLQAQTSWHYSALFKVNSFLKTLAVVYSFNDTTAAPVEILIIAINILWALFILWLFVYLVRGNPGKAIRNDRFVYGACCILFGFLTPHWIRGMGNMDIRFFWLGNVFLLGSALGAERTLSRRITNSIIFVGALILITKSAMIVGQGIAERKFQSELEAAVPENIRFQPVIISLDIPEYYPVKTGVSSLITRICPMTLSRPRIPIYLLLERNIVYSNIFRIGMLDTAPFKCDLKSLIENRSSAKNESCGTILFVSPSGFTDHFLKSLDEHFNTVSRGRGFILAEPTPG